MVQVIKRRRAFAIGLRARVPLITRAIAIFVLVAGVIIVVVSYYQSKNQTRFKLFGGKPELSKQVVSRIEGYERRVMEGDRLKLLVRANLDLTFSDGHHELEGVELESYPATGDKPDRIKSQRAIYNQELNQVLFTGSVNVETHDGLKAQTDEILYDQSTQIAQTDKLVIFSRENISGRTTGAVIDSRAKNLEMKSGVEITVVPTADEAKKNPARGKPVVIRAPRANFSQATLFLEFGGGATIEQDRDIFSGDKIAASFSEKKRIKKIDSRGNSYLRSMSEGRAAEIHSADMDFLFDDEQRLTTALAQREVRVRTLDADSEVQMIGASTVNVSFQIQGDRSVLKEMRTNGRTTVTMAAPQSRASDPRASNKRLIADVVNLIWRVTGRDLERAEAIGSAELLVDPVHQTGVAERKMLYAPRFDCEFFESGNQARTFVAQPDVKAVVEPVQPNPKNPPTTITAQKMTGTFVRETQDIERFESAGDTKFTQGDANGRSENATYVAAEGMIRLRGGEPVVWDSRARVKGNEIDSDNRKHISFVRGRTQTTYYSQEQTGGATPFSKVKSPVWVNSERAEFRHETGVAIFNGNARAWQDDNFVRGDQLTLYRETKRMEAEGHVQSAVYNVRRKGADGSREVVPVFATADRMNYSDTDRVLHYEGNVDVRQATDRITSGVADMYLLKEVNEIEKSIAQRNVVLTQPGRKGTGDWAQYTAADESFVLKGSPARVEDAEQGTNESGRLTVYLRENRVIADDAKGTQSTGRVRSTHKVTKPPTTP